MKSPFLIDFSLKIDDILLSLLHLISNKREGVSKKLQLCGLIELMPVTGTAGLGLPSTSPCVFVTRFHTFLFLLLPCFISAHLYIIFCYASYLHCISITLLKYVSFMNFVNRSLNLIMIGDMNFKFWKKKIQNKVIFSFKILFIIMYMYLLKCKNFLMWEY